MTIKECIDIVDNVKPNQYSIREKVMWLSFVDETIINDVLKTHEGYDGRYDNFEGYTEGKLSVPLIVPSPYDRLYTAYLKMKIDSENGETARYNNSAALYNSYLTEYKKYYNKTHMPLDIKGGESPQRNSGCSCMSNADISEKAAICNAYGQFVAGHYNIIDEARRHVFILGNGTNNNNRSNAMTVTRSGNARFAGKAYIECEDGVGEGKELAAKDYVDTQVSTTKDYTNTQVSSVDRRVSNLETQPLMKFKGVWKNKTFPTTMIGNNTPNNDVVGDTYKLGVESNIDGYEHFASALSNGAILSDSIILLSLQDNNADFVPDNYAEYERIFKILGIVDMDFVFEDEELLIECNRYISIGLLNEGRSKKIGDYTAILESVEYRNDGVRQLIFRGTWISPPPSDFTGISHSRLTYSTDNIYNAYSPHVGYYNPLPKVLKTLLKNTVVTYSLNDGWVDF